MKHLKIATYLLAGAVGLAGCADEATTPLSPDSEISAKKASSNADRINVLLNTSATPEIHAELSTFGQIILEIPQINALVLQASTREISAIQELSYVQSAEPDAQQGIGPLDAVAVDDFADGMNTWNLDAINVTDRVVVDGFVSPTDGRTEPLTGDGVYVGVLDTGLLHTWRLYFPEERIATEYAKAFGGGPNGKVVENPNKWEHDVNSHGTHVTSTIIGYNFGGTKVNGVAPLATVIPVKVLGQTGSGWSSVIAQGITYIADLKLGELSDNPVVINMSLGGGSLSNVQKVAIDYAIEAGVLIVASAGNNGTLGMGYPGAYQPVISVGSAGWGDCNFDTRQCFGQWTRPAWYWANDVAEPTNPDDFYISSFSSRAVGDQDLDVIAPGHWVLGPYQTNRGAHQSYFFLSGTSMASPHVAGIVALMAEKHSALTQAEAEGILEASATAMAAGTQFPLSPTPGFVIPHEWDTTATGNGFITADAALAETP